MNLTPGQACGWALSWDFCRSLNRRSSRPSQCRWPLKNPSARLRHHRTKRMETSVSSSTEFVAGIQALGSYSDHTICHTQTTGGGHRFHGFNTFKFNRARSLFYKHQKNVSFTFKSTGVVELEVRPMTDHEPCTGVVDPGILKSHLLNLLKRQSQRVQGL